MSCSALEVTVGLLLLAGAAAQAQGPAPAVSAEIVRIDVIVTDARGEPVPGLVPEDFAVFEDGKPQRLADVVFVGGPTLALTPVRSSSAPGVSATPLFRREGARHIAIVVDEPHLSQRGAETARQALRSFLGDVVAPDDEIALVVVGSPTATVQPTRDRAALKRAAERIRPRAESLVTGQSAQLTPEQAEQILRGDPAALKLAARLEMEEPGNVVSGRFVPRNVASGPLPVGVDPGEKAAALDAERQARHLLAEAVSVSDVSLRTLERVLRGMARLDGRKLCLFVSDGFLVGRGTSEADTMGLQLVADAATRSGTAVYPLFAGGLAMIGGDAAAIGGAGPAGQRDHVVRLAERQRLETLQGLADDTGGFVVRAADGIGASLGRILREDSAMYLLAYEPANQKPDGRFRRLTVELPRHRDYLVRARKGYFALRKARQSD
jgi:VWFA-related protein